MADKQSGQAPTSHEQLTKAEAVRRALRELGNQATRVEIQRFLRHHFGIEMSVDRISTTKGDVIRQAAAARQKASAQNPAESGRVVNEGEAEAPPPAPRLAGPAAGTGTGGIFLEDVVAVQELIGRVGAGQLRTLIDVLSR